MEVIHSKMRRTKIVRVDTEYEKKMREIMKERFNKNLAKFSSKDLGLPEATRLMLRCPSWNQVERELKSLPKKENLR